MSTAPAKLRRPRKSKFTLGPDHNGMIMTPEEFDAVAEWDEDYSYELIHGVVVVSPVPFESEAGPNQELGRWLLNYQDDHPRGAALDDTLPERYVRTNGSRRKPDRIIWAGLGRQPDPEADFPAIIAEFVSKRKRDRRREYEEKRVEYIVGGAREYWIIDRFQRIMTIIRPGLPDLIVTEGETYTTPLLPGFKLSLAKLLAVADRWAESRQ